MGFLRNIEQRLERAVESFFARTFRSGLHPVELSKAIERYAFNYQQVGVYGVFVPNVYRFELASEDLERFSDYIDSLRNDLADTVRRTASDHGWSLQGSVTIELVESSEVAVGTYALRGKVDADQSQASEPDDEKPRGSAGGTQVMSAPRQARPSREDQALLKVLSGGNPGSQFRVDRQAVIGRMAACEVTLDDPSVSRRHARLSRSGSRWWVEDLGSTNGLRVNGGRVDSIELSDGDRLELGSVRLAFAAEA
jgi:predicted component of type VI protein secretion system